MKHKENQNISRLKANIYKVAIALIFITCGILVLRIWLIPLALEFAEYQVNINAWQTKARRIIIYMNSSQKSCFLKNRVFTDSFENLKIGIYSTENQEYRYLIRVNDKAAFHYVISRRKDLRSHTGAVFVVSSTEGKITLLSIRCQAKAFGVIQPQTPYYQGGKLICGEGTEEL